MNNKGRIQNSNALQNPRAARLLTNNTSKKTVSFKKDI